LTNCFAMSLEGYSFCCYWERLYFCWRNRRRIFSVLEWLSWCAMWL